MIAASTLERVAWAATTIVRLEREGSSSPEIVTERRIAHDILDGYAGMRTWSECGIDDVITVARDAYSATASRTYTFGTALEATARMS